MIPQNKGRLLRLVQSLAISYAPIELIKFLNANILRGRGSHGDLYLFSEIGADNVIILGVRDFT